MSHKPLFHPLSENGASVMHSSSSRPQVMVASSKSTLTPHFGPKRSLISYYLATHSSANSSLCKPSWPNMQGRNVKLQDVHRGLKQVHPSRRIVHTKWLAAGGRRWLALLCRITSIRKSKYSVGCIIFNARLNLAIFWAK